MNRGLRLLPWFFVALFVTELAAVLLPKRDREFHVNEFGRLPVLLEGRVQPFDTVARNALLQIRSTGDLPLEQVPSWQFWRHGKKLKSTEWLLEALFRPTDADQRPVFLIHHPDLLNDLHLADKGIEKSGLRYYSYRELSGVIREIDNQAQRANKTPEAERTAYHKQALKLANAVWLYERLKNSIQPESMRDFAAAVADYKSALPAAVAALRKDHGDGMDETLKRLAPVVQQFNQMALFAYVSPLPPSAAAGNEEWTNIGTSLIAALRSGTLHPATEHYASMAGAYAKHDVTGFNAALAEYRQWLEPQYPREFSKARAEHYYNRIKIFLHTAIMYGFAFALAIGALLTFGTAPRLFESLRRSAYYLIGLAFVVHTFGLGFRMVLEGRPPVTNLYSSAVFIGWGACLLGLVLERIYRVGLGSAMAGLTGLVTLLIAHNLALAGDTMPMLRAVLDTNFWLATHVITITFGYSANFAAGALAIGYIVLGAFTRMLDLKLEVKGDVSLRKALPQMVYAIICFATLFSFLGTVLGGIWADQSWGRFWGWDPKENGALLIVIWNAIILHARWGGLVRERGLMNLAIGGNIVTAFSWFGTNMLGVGLHSYGFMDAAFQWLLAFWAANGVFMLLSLLVRQVPQLAPARDPRTPSGQAVATRSL